MPFLNEIADKVMEGRGFLIKLPPKAEQQLEHLQSPAPPLEPFRDLRHLPWVSIDNDDSRDLDQLTVAEGNKIFIAIADVDALIKKDSPIDAFAANNTTSVYTPTKVFSMLPPKLSTDLTSLNEKQERAAIIVEVNVDAEGIFTLHQIYPALVRNAKKLAYSGVAAFLDKKNGNFPKEIGDQLLLQESITKRIQTYRDQKGALEFASMEFDLLFEGEKPVKLQEKVKNRAHFLIENCMIAANVAVTRYMIEHELPGIRRVVRTPKRWDRIITIAKERGTTLPKTPDAKALRAFLLEQKEIDPPHFPDLSLSIIKLIGRGEYVMVRSGEKDPGHFDLALRDYSHTTAPNRRFPDLITQRLLKSSLYNHSPSYTESELSSLAAHCTQKEDDAMKVERRMRKSAAALVLAPQLGHLFRGIVTGAGPKGTWVRLFNPPVEGKITENFHHLDVGDTITVKLIHVDSRNGYIDFAKM